jgi:hypothetical protein
VIRQPSIQLRSRAPRVRTFAAWRFAHARQICEGCLIATSRLRQKMKCAHRCADESFDVATEVRRAKWTKVDLDTMLLTPKSQRS